MNYQYKAAKFQSTHPRGVRRIVLAFFCFYSCFNPRTHEGCDQRQQAYCGKPLVSIHAPTRGATCFFVYVGRCYKSFNPRTHEGCDSSRIEEISIPAVSIHAPTRGATQKYLQNERSHHQFQSTHPRGVRPQKSVNDSIIALFQSTHPRGVRQKSVV